MITTLRRLLPGRGRDSAAPAVDDPAVRGLVTGLHYELIPMKSVEQAIDDLPPGANVSVTCSPAKGIAATREITDRLVALGHRPVPHIAARLVEGPEHTAELAAWLKSSGADEVFIVAGDAPEPAGPYEGALAFLRDLVTHDHGMSAIGVTGYPDGHAMFDAAVASEQLLAKQEVLDTAGVRGWCTTQMCFDTAKILDWLRAERAAGVHLPIRLGLPGVVDRTRLMTVGTRLGIGASLRYLSKNRSTVMALMSPGGFDPTDMVVDIAAHAEAMDIEAIHSFTFNSVADTRLWHEQLLG